MTIDKKDFANSSSGANAQAVAATNVTSHQASGMAMNASFASPTHRIIAPTTEVISVCSSCGQAHDPLNSPHLYDYREQTDPEMLCHICKQPLVDPEDASCRHTFCRLCILAYFQHNGINVQGTNNEHPQHPEKGTSLCSSVSDDEDRAVPCPADQSHTITFRSLQPASSLVRRLLDKLLVVCPNVDYCEQVLPRSELTTHLCFSCLGALSQCPNSKLGCRFVGPRATIHNHTQCECAYRNDANAYQYVNPHGDAYQSTNELALAGVGTSAAQLRLQAEQQALAHGAFTLMHSSSAAGLSALDPAVTTLSHQHQHNAMLNQQQAALAHATLVSHGGDSCRGLATMPYGAQTTAYQHTTTTSSLIGVQQRRCADDYRQHTTLQTQMQSSTAKYVIGGLGTLPPMPPPLTYATRTAPIPLATPFDVAAAAALSMQMPQGAPVEGEPCMIELSRGSFDLGVSIVGGIDTPLTCVIIQEIYVDGVVARDGRLRAGDQLLEANGCDLRQATHYEARDALQQLIPLCRLTVYRDRADVRFMPPRRVSTTSSLQQPTRSKTPALPPPPLPGGIRCDSPRARTDSQSNTLRSQDGAAIKAALALTLAEAEREEKLRVILYKQPDKQLGIKLAHKRAVENGLFVAGLVPDSLAVLDGRVKKDDRVLEINGVDMTTGTKELAAQLIQSAANSVEFVVVRKTRAQTPDILRQTASQSPTTAKSDAECAPSTPSKLLSRTLPQRAIPLPVPVPVPVPVPGPAQRATSQPPDASEPNNNEEDASSSVDFPPPPPELTRPDAARPNQPPKGSGSSASPSPAQQPGSLQNTLAHASKVKPVDHREKGCDSMLKRGALSLNLKLNNLLGRARHDTSSATDEESRDGDDPGRDKAAKDDKAKQRRGRSLLRKKKPDASKATESPAKSKRPAKGSGKALKSAPSSPTQVRRNTAAGRNEPNTEDALGRRASHARSQANLSSLSTGLTKSQSIASRAQYADLRLAPAPVSGLAPVREKVVELHKTPNESLGMSVAGGLHSQRGDIPIYITNVQEGSCASHSQRIKRGDVLLSVNQCVLLGLTHDQAVMALRTESQTRARLVLNLIESPEPACATDNFMPSWLFWLRLPAYCQISKMIELERDRQTDSLGFAIIGGLHIVAPPEEPDHYDAGTDAEDADANADTARKSSLKLKAAKSAPQTPAKRAPPVETRQQAIVIRSIVPDSPAALDGRLRCGDLILALNNFSLESLTHQQVVALLKQLPSPVVLTVVSWPGTIV